MFKPVRAVLTACLCLAALVTGLTPGIAEAQGWPQRTVRLVLPFGPGASTDVTARLIADKLKAKWGQSVIVENRPGGDGLVSIGSVVSSKDDHVLFFSPTSVFIVHPYLHPSLPYDPALDLLPVVRISKTLLVLAAPSALPAKNLGEFIDFVRQNPGKYNWAMTPGFTEFVFEGFLREQGLVMSKVPYRDIVQAPIDLGENRIQILGVSHTVASGQIAAGRVKLLAVADSKRSGIVPDAPTVVEAGFPSLESVSIIGIFGQRGMPLELRKQIARDVTAIVEEPAVAEKIKAAAQDIELNGPEEFAAAMNVIRKRVDTIATLVGRSKK